MHHDTVFNPAFIDALLMEIRVCMALAVTEQARIHTGDGFVQVKPDQSPVTDADLAIQKRLEHFLLSHYPDYGFVGEESVDIWRDAGAMPDLFWLCDPIDGTIEYAKGGTEFSINVALIKGDTPIFGLIAAPVSGDIAYTHAPHGVTFIRDDQSSILVPPSRRSQEAHILITGHDCAGDVHAYEMAVGQPPKAIIECASALKFHPLIQGAVDVYARHRQTSEWDIAAGHALVNALGGQSLTLDKTPLTYGHINRGFKLDSVLITR